MYLYFYILLVGHLLPPVFQRIGRVELWGLALGDLDLWRGSQGLIEIRWQSCQTSDDLPLNFSRFSLCANLVLIVQMPYNGWNNKKVTEQVKFWL